MRRAIAFALAAAGLAGGAGLSVAPAQVAARDWTRAVAATPDGGYRIGNPAAPVKLVEYGSLTCSHCAHFAQEGVPPLLANYVKTGKVSYEFRNFVRDPADMTASILSRCATTENYFPLTERYFSTQPQWFGRFQAMTDAQAKEITSLPPAERIPRFASFAGLDTIAAQNGVTSAKAKACLADKAAAERLAAMRKVAIEQHQLEGTPMFIVNGKKVPAYDWATLEPLLKAAGG